MQKKPLKYLPICLGTIICAYSAWCIPSSTDGQALAPQAEYATIATSAHEALQSFVERHEIAGAVSLTSVSGKVETTYVGLADPTTGRAFNEKSLFYIASMTKGFTAAAVMTCVEKGLCKLDDPVAQYIPEIRHVKVAEKDKTGNVTLRPPKVEMTIRMCLSHVTGFPFRSPIEEKRGSDTMTLAEHAAAAVQCPLLSDPLVQHKYSNIGINLAGRIVEIVTGMEFAEYMRVTFFEPLNMRSATFKPDLTQFSNCVFVARVEKDKPYEDGCNDYWAKALQPQKFTQKVRHAIPAGGLYATAQDVMAFYNMLANDGCTRDGKRILSHNTILELAKAQYPNLDRYTLGLRQYGDWFGHDGALQTEAYANWKENRACLLFVQITGRWNHPFKLAWRKAVGVMPSTLKRESFAHPPPSARPHTWYHMMNGNVTKEGITCDFEALARAGIGGVQMFDAGCGVPPGKIAFNSPEWFDLFLHAAKEARRLGLEICIPNCSGWSSSGGPWNPASNGMKRVVHTLTPVQGGQTFKGILPRTKEDFGFYEDIAVVAFKRPAADMITFPGAKSTCTGKTALFTADKPFTAAGISYKIDGRYWSATAEALLEAVDEKTSKAQTLEHFNIILGKSGASDCTVRYHAFAKPIQAKTLRLTLKTNANAKLSQFAAEAKRCVEDLSPKTFGLRTELPRSTIPAAREQIVTLDSVIDLTSQMKQDGMLEWTAPPGNDWMLLRIGHVCNGAKNHPASTYGRGLEVDKFSARALDYHFDQYIARLCKHLGTLAGNVASGFNNILVDSYEVGAQNWTQGFEKTFAQRRGYSLIPYLPVFAGYIVTSTDETERFLEDFRCTVGELFSENYAGRLAELCHTHGLKLSLEPYGSCPANNLQYGRAADIPMGEFWSAAGTGDHASGCGNTHYVSALAHVWGKRIVGTESFTAGPNGGGRWMTTPFAIKAQGDRAFAAGSNRIIYHRFTHQPWPGNQYLPGMTMGRWGMHLDRTQTWWPYAKDWFQYQTRCQWMLQEGIFVADVLFYAGEEVPNQCGNTDGGNKEVFYKLPYGYQSDTCEKSVLKHLKVVNGRIVVPGGVSYAILALPPSDMMSLEVMETLENLIKAGAHICTTTLPTRIPGLHAYQAQEKQLAQKVKALTPSLMMCSPVQALTQLGIAPDFDSNRTDAHTGAVYIHRRDTQQDWYFVACNNTARDTFEASFRMTGRIPELWDPMTGKTMKAPLWRVEKDRTIVTLDFEPSGSIFVVFPKAGKAKTLPRHLVKIETKGQHAEATNNVSVPAWTWYGEKILAWQPLFATGTFSDGTTQTVHANPPPAMSITGDWHVSFPTDWYTGGTNTMAFTWPCLYDWKNNDNADIRYFSGTATYQKETAFATPTTSKARVILDLGVVKNFAEVTVNGKTFPVLWKPPYRLDITEALKPNARAIHLTLRVTNLWPNRLIGDDALPEDVTWVGRVSDGVKEIGVKEIPAWVKAGKKSPTGRHTFTTWRHWAKDEPLLSSGLLGPVTIHTATIAE